MKRSKSSTQQSKLAPKPKPPKPKPEWDFGYKDHSLYKLSKEELLAKKASLVSKNREKAAEEWRNLQKKLQSNIRDEQTQRVLDVGRPKSQSKTKNLTQFVRQERKQRLLSRSPRDQPNCTQSQVFQPKTFMDILKNQGINRNLSDVYSALTSSAVMKNVMAKEVLEDQTQQARRQDEKASEAKKRLFLETVECPLRYVQAQDQSPIKDSKIAQTQAKLIRLKQLLNQKQKLLKQNSNANTNNPQPNPIPAKNIDFEVKVIPKTLTCKKPVEKELPIQTESPAFIPAPMPQQQQDQEISFHLTQYSKEQILQQPSPQQTRPAVQKQQPSNLSERVKMMRAKVKGLQIWSSREIGGKKCGQQRLCLRGFM